MSDHWKSLADRLGAPSFEPSVRRTKELPSQPVAPPTAPSGPPSVDDTKGSLEEPQRRANRQQVTDSSQSAVERAAISPQSLPEPVDQAPAIADEPAKKKKRSNWERVANLFGLGPEPEPEPEPQVQPAEVLEPVRQPTESRQARAASPQKDASSLEKKTRHPQRESRSSAAASDDLGLFDAAANRDDTNPVLAEMFGAPPSNFTDAWEKPSRMVDDIGWDEPANDPWSVPDDDRDLVLETTSEIADDDQDDSDASDSEQSPRRRSRRRRRRGKRVDGPAARSEDRSDIGAEMQGASHASNDEGGDLSDDVSSDDVTSDDVSSGEMPERRSSRRSRFRRTERSGPSHAQPRSSEGMEVEPRSIEEDEPELADERVAPSGDFDADSSGSASTGRRRRRRRSRGSGRSDRLESQDQLPVDREGSEAVDDLEELDLEDSPGEGREGNRSSRNIPTWEETLSVLVTANIENHRRNESRGSRGGGRPRGRR
jgi:ribonuclease E